MHLEDPCAAESFYQEESDMQALLARYHVQSGKADLVEKALRDMGDAVRRDEPLCLTYHARALDGGSGRVRSL